MLSILDLLQLALTNIGSFCNILNCILINSILRNDMFMLSPPPTSQWLPPKATLGSEFLDTGITAKEG